MIDRHNSMLMIIRSLNPSQVNGSYCWSANASRMLRRQEVSNRRGTLQHPSTLSTHAEKGQRDKLLLIFAYLPLLVDILTAARRHHHGMVNDG